MKTDYQDPFTNESDISEAMEFALSMGLKRPWQNKNDEISCVDFAHAMGLRHNLRAGDSTHRRRYAKRSRSASPVFG